MTDLFTAPRRRDVLALGLGAFVVAAVPLAAGKRRRAHRRTIPVMGTIADCVVVSDDTRLANAALDAAVAELRRVDALMAEGLLDEVRGLLGGGVPADARPMRSLGYAEIAAHLRGEATREEALEAIRRGHRRYAKRQLTWFRKVAETIWLAPGDRERAHALVRGHFEGT